MIRTCLLAAVKCRFAAHRAKMKKILKIFKIFEMQRKSLQ